MKRHKRIIVIIVMLNTLLNLSIYAEEVNSYRSYYKSESSSNYSSSIEHSIIETSETFYSTVTTNNSEGNIVEINTVNKEIEKVNGRITKKMPVIKKVENEVKESINTKEAEENRGKVNKGNENKVTNNNITADKKTLTEEILTKEVIMQNNKSNKNFILYTAKWCTFCKKVKGYLESKNVNVEERDIEKNENWAEEAKILSDQGAIPITLYNGVVAKGYDIEELNNIIRQYENNSINEYKKADNSKQKIIEEINNNKIVIYGLDIFPNYLKAKEYFDLQGIKYKDKNLCENINWIKEITKITNKPKMPIIIAGDKILKGFDKTEIDKLIENIGINTNIQEENKHQNSDLVINSISTPVKKGHDIIITGSNFDTNSTIITVCLDEEMCFKTKIKSITETQIVLENIYDIGKYHVNVFVGELKSNEVLLCIEE